MSANTNQKKIRLYELVLDNGRSASPYVWRTRYALAHKGLSCESVHLGLMEIPKVFAGRFKTVPVIDDGEVSVVDSWDIAEYLDREYSDRPPLFSGPAEIAMVRLFDACFSLEVMRKMFRICALNLHDSFRPGDRPYFRQSREDRIGGKTLEAFTADRASRIPELRSALAPLRMHLSKTPFLGGSAPNYADYIALGAFHWYGSVCDLPLLPADDSLIPWLNRGFDLYGGLGRDSRMKPLIEVMDS